MELLGIDPTAEYRATTDPSQFSLKNSKVQYELEASDNSTFLPGMSVNLILVSGEVRHSVGFMGVVHPDVLHNFELKFPSSVVEINLDQVLEIINPKLSTTRL